MSKPIRNSIIGVAVFLIFIGGLFAYYLLCMEPHRNSYSLSELPQSRQLTDVLTNKEACDDLDYMYKTICERHPAWLDGSEKLTSEFENQYKTERSKFGDKVTVEELYVASLKIAAKLHDGHTDVLYNSSEQLFLSDFTQLNNIGTPLSVDGIAFNTLLKKYTEINSSEFDFYTEYNFKSRGIVSEFYLRQCGVDTSDGVIMEFENGESYSYDFVRIDEIKGLEGNNTGESRGWVYYDIDKENSLGIFTLTTCEYNDEYRQTVKDFFEEVFSNEIENIAVDLRGNGGGSSTVANEFLTYIDVDSYKTWDAGIRFGWYLYESKNNVIQNEKKSQTFDGKLYVLTNINTYSSAMDFAMLVADNNIGEIIGEASGNNPSGYGECASFYMKNSKLGFMTSVKKWYRVDLSKNGEPLMPDYEVKSNKAIDYLYSLVKK